MNHKYRTLLSLDCICGYFLTIYERHVITKLINNHSDAPPPTTRISKVLELIDLYNWEQPKYNIEHSRLIYFLEDDSWKHISEYKHPIINEINKIR